MNNGIRDDAAIRYRELIRIAYRLWREAGRPDGPYTRFWTEAERIVDSAPGFARPCTEPEMWREKVGEPVTAESR